MYSPAKAPVDRDLTMVLGFDTGTRLGQQAPTRHTEGQAPPEMRSVEAARVPGCDPAPASPASGPGASGPHALRTEELNELWTHRVEALRIESHWRSTIRSPMMPVARALFGRPERHDIDVRKFQSICFFVLTA